MLAFFDENSSSESSNYRPAPPAAAGQDCAGEAAQQSRSSNTAIVNPSPEWILLHFGLDWLVFYIGDIYPIEGMVFQFFNGLFREYLEDELTNLYGQQWFDSEYKVDFIFRKGKGDLFSDVYLDGRKVLCIRKITVTTTMPSSVANLYRYQVSVYGEFFALEKCGKLDFKEFWSVLLGEVRLELFPVIIAQVHICIDIENATTKQLQKGIKVLSKKHAKPTSEISRHPETGIAETIYWGNKGDSYCIRIYNKLAEIYAHKKELLYPHLWGKTLVTRLEIECRRTVCKSLDMTLERCLDRSFLLSVLRKHLKTKYVHWSIFSFIEKSLSKEGVFPYELERVQGRDVDKITKDKAYEVAKKKILSCAERYELAPVDFIRLMITDFEDMQSATPERVWE